MKFEVKPKKQVRLGQVGIGSKRKSHYICKLKIQAKPIRKSQANLKKPSQAEKTSKNDLTWLWKICPLYILVENVSVENMSVDKMSRCRKAVFNIFQ